MCSIILNFIPLRSGRVQASVNYKLTEKKIKKSEIKKIHFPLPQVFQKQKNYV